MAGARVIGAEKLLKAQAEALLKRQEEVNRRLSELKK